MNLFPPKIEGCVWTKPSLNSNQLCIYANPLKNMMARQEKARNLTKQEEPRMFKGKAFNQKMQQQQHNRQFKSQSQKMLTKDWDCKIRHQIFNPKLLRLTIHTSNFINKKKSILGKASMSSKTSGLGVCSFVNLWKPSYSSKCALSVEMFSTKSSYHQRAIFRNKIHS